MSAPDMDPDFGAMAREHWLCLGPADRLRWMDARLRELGPTPPVPEFADIAEDARLWCDGCLSEVLKIYMAAIWASFSDKDRAAFLRWAERRKDGA